MGAMPRIDSNGQAIEYLDQGAGEPVLALHCSASSSSQWRSLPAQLREGYRIIAPDLIGYGASAGWHGERPFRLADEAAAVCAVLGYPEEPVHLVGHSYGGLVALHIARKRPRLVRSLTLIEPAAFPLLASGDRCDLEALDDVVSVAAELMAALGAGDYCRGMERLVDFWSGPGSWARTPAEKRAKLAPCLAKVVLDFSAASGEAMEFEDLRGLSPPTLLLQGGHTTPLSRRICTRLQDALPAASVHTIPGAGHMAPITHCDEVSRLIADHIGAHSAHSRRSTWKASSPPTANATRSA